MNSSGNMPHQPERQRRAERYAGEFLRAPSMSAPQPIPEAKGKRNPTPQRTAHSAETNSYPAQTGQQMNAAAQAEAMAAAPQQGWSQSYQMPPGAQPDWSQQYAAQTGTQPGGQPGWSQQYAAQPGAQPGATQGWSQPYAPQPGAQPGATQGWSQPYAPQPGSTQGWSQPYTPQPGGAQGWSQPYAPQHPVQQAQNQTGWSGDHYAPPTPLSNAAGGSDGGAGRGGNAWWKLTLLVVLLVALVTGAVIGGVRLTQSSALHTQVSAYNDRFCEGVYVDGIHLGGMTQQEAIAAVQANAEERMAAWSINLTYGGRLIRQITAADLGMSVNVNDALAEAWQQGHESDDVIARKAAMDALLETPYQGYTAMPSGDTSAVDHILNALAEPVYRMPQDATVTFDPQAHAYPFEYTPEVPGTYLDVRPIKAQIYAMVDTMESGSIELEPQSIAPRVTEADLRRTRTLRATATTDISTTSTQERTTNIQRAFQLINGTVLKPGESFSFNGVVGPRSAKNGFMEAIEYAYGNERMGYGGGVCQASTTIYLAAVRANMTITHREPHSDKVNYTEYGLDATVNYDGKKIDLTFKNTTGSDVYIMSYLVRSGGRWVCQVDIYGEAFPEGVTYDLIAETVEILPAPVDPEYINDESGTHVVYIDDAPVQKRKASDGYVVETFIVQYRDGKEVHRSYVARDTYKAKAQQLWVGVQERDDYWGN